MIIKIKNTSKHIITNDFEEGNHGGQMEPNGGGWS